MYYYGKNSLNSLDKKKVNKVLSLGYISQGKSLTDLENKFSKYVGAKYCLAVSSGTAGLHLAIASLNLNKNLYRIIQCLILKILINIVYIPNNEKT